MQRGEKRLREEDDCAYEHATTFKSYKSQPATKKRENHRSRFIFAYYGVFDPKAWSERLDLRSIMTTEDTRGLKYAFIKTKEKRASEIESHINRHDSEVPDGMKVKLSRIAGYDSIISFGKGEDPAKHAIYKTMMKCLDSQHSRESHNAASAQSQGKQPQSDSEDKGGMTLSELSDENSMDSASSSGSSFISRLKPLLAAQTEKIRDEIRKELEERDKQREQLLKDQIRKELEQQFEQQYLRQKELAAGQETKIDENTSILQDIAAGQEKIIETNHELVTAQQARIDEGNSLLQDIAATQELIASNQTESTFLTRNLEMTTLELDEERKKKRSNAGRLAAQTRKANKALARQAKLEAERLQIIDHSEVITVVRQFENRLDGMASQLGLNVALPFGNLDNKGPYESWMERNGYDVHYQQYKINLENNCKGARVMVRRDDLSPAPEFPEEAKIRLFMYGLAVLFRGMENSWNLDNSPAKQKFDLAVYSCSIVIADTFEEIKDILETQIEFFSNSLSLPYEKDTTVYPTIQGDAFQVPEMQSWKLEPVIHSQKFKEYRKKFMEKYPGYTLQTCWRYFTFLHLVGADARHTHEVNADYIEWFQNGKFYSKETLNLMESKYLERISQLKQKLQDTSEFDAAAKEVIYRAKMRRQSSRSTRCGKIKNHS